MKKILLLIISVSLLIPINIYARQKSGGSINVTHKYGDISIADNKIYLYKVATSNENLEFTYLDDYKLDDSLDIKSASEWNDLAIKLDKYIKDNKIKITDNCITDSEGKCSFKDLEFGLYLLSSDQKNIDNYEYISSPTLISIPTYNENDYTLIHDVDVTLKTESKQIKEQETIIPESNNDNNDIVDKPVKNNTTIPNTIDMLYSYITLLIISVIAIVLVVLYIKKKRRKNKNEKDN